MNGKTKVTLNFGIDEIESNQYMAYGKIPGIPTDAVFALVSKRKNAVEVVFMLSGIVLDAERVLQDNSQDAASDIEPPSPEALSKLRVQLLIEFLNSLVKQVLLEEEGATRLVLSFDHIKGFDIDQFREVKEGINSADTVTLNTLSRKLILLCE